eukprot:CAMPEP_0171326158 /NCGR_PEP_ID=MMETSP0816-20121228/117268_1 /TAXON_ID=420281 /ORGANISM="Proboscia inermis, Strain CCAP1064/1" /LENGTH=151 /DNA_ID=CAMNT_0011825533 /DNA_START=232 /DNA_END=688 /DNA_ORIENTATION=+
MLRKVAGELLEVFESVVVRYVNVVVCTALGVEIPPEWMVREETQPQSPPEKEEQVTATINDDPVDNDDAPKAQKMQEIPPEWMVREEEQPQSPPEKEEQVTAMINDDTVDNDAPIGTEDSAPVTEDTVPETHDAINHDNNETPETVPDASN